MPNDFSIFITADGSPTLAFARADGYIEKMHHSGGALSESLYIYHQALTAALSEKLQPRVLSVGLGLGYNELISLAEFHRSHISDFKVWSLEAHPILRNAFRVWAGLETESEFAENHSIQNLNPVCEVVATAAGQVALQMKIAYDQLRNFTKESLENKNLELLGPFPQALTTTDKINAVYYDAYSNKMDSGLWSEHALTQQLGPCLADQCVFATYAATGTLNRSLKNLGFRLMLKAGFQGKRESTYAVRGFQPII